MNFSLRFGDPSIFESGDQDTALEVLTESFSKDVSLIPVDPADLDSLTTEPVYYLNSSAGVTSISTVNPTVPTMELMRRFIGARCKTIGGLLILPKEKSEREASPTRLQPWHFPILIVANQRLSQTCCGMGESACKTANSRASQHPRNN